MLFGFSNGLIVSESESTLTQYAILALNIFLTPFFLAIYSIQIYVLPCIQNTLANCCCGLLFDSCTFLHCFKYTDNEFPANDTSLGAYEAKKSDRKVIWMRCGDIISVKSKEKLHKLFSNGVLPTDIAQGALGDCWLLSALASLSEHPHFITEVFLTDSYNPRGKYRFRFWDELKKKTVIITIDDFIPVDAVSLQPIFAKPNLDDEIWVMLLEKAFAKFRGSYHDIEGGNALYAMSVLTGCEVNKFCLKGESWDRLEMKVAAAKVGENSDSVHFYYANTKNKFLKDRMFDLMVDYSKKGCLLAGGSKGEDKMTISRGGSKKNDKDDNKGIVPGHCYTILSCCKPTLTMGNVRLLKVRNPW